MTQRDYGSSPPKRGKNKDGGKGNGKGGGNKHKASSPHKNHGKNTPQSSTIVPLNPPFDPRMRRIGSPLNLTSQIKRGWIQDEKATKRVDFLYNPSQLDLSHALDPNARTTRQVTPNDTMDVLYAATQSTTGVSLLYDRTYELFSSGKTKGKVTTDTMANEYGVYADVAAWYTYLKMLPDMPTSWTESLFAGPLTMVPSFLFVGPKLVYYGYPSSMNVTYSHWTQYMIPQRCKVDIGFTILPKPSHIDPIPIDMSQGLVQGMLGWKGDYAVNGFVDAQSEDSSSSSSSGN